MMFLEEEGYGEERNLPAECKECKAGYLVQSRTFQNGHAR